MFDQIKAMFDLRKEIPDAVGYDVYGPTIVPLPLEIRATAPESIILQLDRLSVLTIRVHNCSSKTQRNVRVLFSGSWAFTPQFSFDRRDIEVKNQILVEDKEIVLLEIPPNDSVSIDIFNPENGFRVEQVLLGDTAITKLMQKLVQTKRYPSMAKAEFIYYMVMLIAIPSLCGTLFFVWSQISDHRKIEAAHAGLASCISYVFQNKPGNEAILERKIQQAGPYLQAYIFYLNKVSSLNDLKLKDELILCDQQP